MFRYFLRLRKFYILAPLYRKDLTYTSLHVRAGKYKSLLEQDLVDL